MSSRIIRLAQLISSKTSVIDDYLQRNNLPQPTFDIDGPLDPIKDATDEIQNAKINVIEAAIELRQLLEGPMKCILPEVPDLSLFFSLKIR